MSWVAVAVGASTVIGVGASAISANAQRSAANKATDAASAATMYGVDAQMEQFNKAMEQFKPFWEAGVEGLKQLQRTRPGASEPQLPSTTIDFKFDPDDELYKIQQEEGEEAINRALAARNMYNSRPGINALSDFNRKLIAEETQNQYGRAVDKYNRDYTSAIDTFNIRNKLAGQEYGKWLDLTKIGAGAAQSAGAASIQTGQGVASSYNQLANTQFQGNMAAGQAQANLWQDIGSAPVNALASYYYGKKADLWG